MKRLRLAATGGIAAVTLALAGCGSSAPSAAPPAPTGGAAAPTTSAAGTANTQRVTTISDIMGPACSKVPAEGPGSAKGMVDDPVATAAGNNPLLTTLTKAVKAAGLVDTLNDPSASYTVFAPANAAFEALPPGTLDQLLADKAKLTQILTYHVVPKRYDAAGLAEAGTVTTVEGSKLTITGEPGSLVIDQQEQASVLCGNIPTANATVFVIDTILMPAS